MDEKSRVKARRQPSGTRLRSGGDRLGRDGRRVPELGLDDLEMRHDAFHAGHLADERDEEVAFELVPHDAVQRDHAVLHVEMDPMDVRQFEISLEVGVEPPGEGAVAFRLPILIGSAMQTTRPSAGAFPETGYLHIVCEGRTSALTSPALGWSNKGGGAVRMRSMRRSGIMTMGTV